MMDLSNEELQRYNRHLLLDEFGADAQLRLKAAKVLVVGAGGLGCPCLLYLAAAGLGVIGIADDDKVSVSNLQRQVLFTTNDVGKYKAETAKRILLEMNPFIKINTHGRIIAENALEVIADYDIVIDGTDNFLSRYLLNDACVILKRPLIYGALFKFEGQISVFNYIDGPTYRCLYPEVTDATVPGCSDVGVLGVLPGIIGTMQATEAIKIITGLGEPLSGRLFSINMLNNTSEIFSFKAIAANKVLKELGRHDISSEAGSNEIDSDTLELWEKKKDVQLLDVREEYEFERYNIGGLNLPLTELEERLDVIRADKVTVVVCQTGSRSLKAIGIIKTTIPGIEIYHLRGGLQNI